MENLDVKTVLDSFRGKKVFITGHTGFKGSWLTYWLHQLGADIMGLALEPKTNPNLFELLRLNGKCQSRIGNINDASLVEQLITDFQPEFIFHLAAQPLVRYSYKQPLETLNTNIIGTANILNACSTINNKCVVICVTTDKVYHNFEWEYPYRENDRLGGYDPYSASKAAAEIVIDSFRNSFYKDGKIKISSVRAGNVIGGGDWTEDRLIPDFIKSISTGSKIILRNPSAIRPWQHVLDPLFGYLSLAIKMESNLNEFEGAWNFGPMPFEAINVLEVSKSLLRVFEKGEVKIEKELNQPHEAGILKLDISKAIDKLNWKPRWDTAESIRITANWYRQFLEGANPENLIDNDIKNFIIG
jgi:CDP-glucose 4,6-dehydratase